jgi:hypothetical protein
MLTSIASARTRLPLDPTSGDAQRKIVTTIQDTGLFARNAHSGNRAIVLNMHKDQGSLMKNYWNVGMYRGAMLAKPGISKIQNNEIEANVIKVIMPVECS